VAEVARAIEAAGKRGYAEPSTKAIIERVLELAEPGDTVIVFSNGSFDGIHDKLLERLGALERA